MSNANAPTHLISVPVVIDGPGLYRTRAGEIVEILKVAKGPSGMSLTMERSCYGRYSCGIPDTWFPCGYLFRRPLSDHDIVSRA